MSNLIDDSAYPITETQDNAADTNPIPEYYFDWDPSVQGSGERTYRWRITVNAAAFAAAGPAKLWVAIGRDSDGFIWDDGGNAWASPTDIEPWFSRDLASAGVDTVIEVIVVLPAADPSTNIDIDFALGYSGYHGTPHPPGWPQDPALDSQSVTVSSPIVEDISSGVVSVDTSVTGVGGIDVTTIPDSTAAPDAAALPRVSGSLSVAVTYEATSGSEVSVSTSVSATGSVSAEQTSIDAGAHAEPHVRAHLTVKCCWEVT